MTNIFEGKLIRLRGIEPSDWEKHAQWDRDTEMARLTYEIPFPQSAAWAQEWAEREAKRGAENDQFRFQIETLDGVLVGSINTHTTHPRNGTFSYGISIIDEHRRKGYAAEAIRLLLSYFFNERRYQKCNAEVYAFNQPSMRLHERLGFTLEGRLRRMIYTGGAFHDALIYGITREEFESTVSRS